MVSIVEILLNVGLSYLGLVLFKKYDAVELEGEKVSFEQLFFYVFFGWLYLWLGAPVVKDWFKVIGISTVIYIGLFVTGFMFAVLMHG